MKNWFMEITIIFILICIVFFNYHNIIADKELNMQKELIRIHHEILLNFYPAGEPTPQISKESEEYLK